MRFVISTNTDKLIQPFSIVNPQFLGGHSVRAFSHYREKKLNRAQVRRWALANHLARAVPPKNVLAPVSRWQRRRTGELWQLDPNENCPPLLFQKVLL